MNPYHCYISFLKAPFKQRRLGRDDSADGSSESWESNKGNQTRLGNEFLKHIANTDSATAGSATAGCSTGSATAGTNGT